MNDLLQISGISQGKASKYGKPFIELIKEFVENNEIERPGEIVIKQVANKSKDKVTIIQGIDRKLPFEDIARSVDMSMEDLVERLNIMVDGGTKLDINYFLEDNLDEEIIEEIFDYFHKAESASLSDAFKELKDDDISMEELTLVRIKFMSEVAN
jgi:ATP-dependent DNA helicase RecQ